MTDKSVDPPSNKTCDNCHESKEIKEFLKNNKVLIWCQSCRDKRKISRLNKSTNQRHDTTITYSDISEFVYNSLISLENTNDFYEDDNTELVISFDIELSSFISMILDKDDKENFDNNENFILKLHVIQQNLLKKAMRQVKHPNPEVHRDTPIRIERYNSTTVEIREFIKKKQLKGYENLTVQQTYFWWSKESQKMYHRNPDPFILTKLLLTELNQEIIIDITVPTPALGFLTVLFYQLPHNNFDAVQIDATYGTNKMGWELYAIMGVIDGTGFPISYLLISAGKNFSEINATQKVWPNVRLQLCFWHVLRAIKQRVASNQPISNCSYDPTVAYQECSSVDPFWKKSNNCEFVNPFCFHNPKVLEILTIKESIIEYEDNYTIEGGNDNEDNEYEIEADKEQEIYNQNLNHLNNLLNKAKNLLEKSHEKSKGHLWLRNVYSNFKPLKKMVVDIETLENQHTMPRISKDFNRNTLYWD
ncbi:40873_t:CDS:2 [Gigaspora margarita]|uniref:40873_t:CDS:1 n=1 Tax=Gigaspora margarita TaxID=4874 RepID=A0ABN7UQ94_GIGMA|nr:40873_t:CDS:2 [Gigaspora margarita]